MRWEVRTPRLPSSPWLQGIDGPDQVGLPCAFWTVGPRVQQGGGWKLEITQRIREVILPYTVLCGPPSYPAGTQYHPSAQAPGWQSSGLFFMQNKELERAVGGCLAQASASCKKLDIF